MISILCIDYIMLVLILVFMFIILIASYVALYFTVYMNYVIGVLYMLFASVPAVALVAYRKWWSILIGVILIVLVLVAQVSGPIWSMKKEGGSPAKMIPLMLTIGIGKTHEILYRKYGIHKWN